MNPVTHDSDEWLRVQRSLTDLELGQKDLATRLDAFDERQRTQHKINSEEIGAMKLALYGEPGDKENIGLVRTVDRVLVYVAASSLWVKAIFALLMLIAAYLGLRFR